MARVFHCINDELIKLNENQARQIFTQYLGSLSQGMWLNDRGKIETEGHTSHSFYYDVTPKELGGQDKYDKHVRLLKAIKELEEAIK